MDISTYLFIKREDEDDSLYLPVTEYSVDNIVGLTNPYTDRLDKNYFSRLNSISQLNDLSEIDNLQSILECTTGIKDKEFMKIINQIIKSTTKLGMISGYLSKDLIEEKNIQRFFIHRNYRDGNEEEFDKLDSAVQLYKQDLIIPVLKFDNNMKYARVGYFPTEKLIDYLDTLARNVNPQNTLK